MIYKKHQLYLDNYPIQRGTVVQLPEKCSWVVRKYVGQGEFALPDEEIKGSIALILNENREQDKGFWSVVSFLTKSEAIELIKQLEIALGEK